MDGTDDMDGSGMNGTDSNHANPTGITGGGTLLPTPEQLTPAQQAIRESARRRLAMPGPQGATSAPHGGETPAWPIHVDQYDPVPGKRSSRRLALTAMLVTVVFVLLSFLATQSSATDWLAGIMLTVALIALMAVFAGLGSMIRGARVPDQPGLLITGAAILDAYGPHGLREIALSTPIAGKSLDEDHVFKLARNDVRGLWFQPTADTRFYVLWWRDEDYRGVNLDHLIGKPVEQPGYEKPTAAAMRGSQKYLDQWREEHGLDLRMWPCVLEVRGSQARLMFAPDAVKTSEGSQDLEIGMGPDDDVMMLVDTFPPRKGGRR